VAHGDDVDPASVRSVEEFAVCLRRLRARAGNISYRTLERWGKSHEKPLPRSTVLEALGGKRLPRKDLLLAFVEACGIDPQADTRWLAAWTRLADPALPAEQQLPAQVANDVRVAGLRRIGTRYLSELEWAELFSAVRELDIFVAYGQTWRNLHARELAQVAERKTATIRVYLADPDDDDTVAVLAGRFDITPDELRTRIQATRKDYAALRQPGGALIEIYCCPGDRVFSFYRFDNIAVVGLYSHARSRATSVPVFVCSAPGELFHFISDELAIIQQRSRPL
jgi:hypothetical protein